MPRQQPLDLRAVSVAPRFGVREGEVVAFRIGEWMLAPEAGPVLDQIRDAFYVVDPSWRFVRINRAAEQFWDRSREVLLGRQIWDCFPAAVGSQPYDMHLRCAAGQTSAQFVSVSPVTGSGLAIRIVPLKQGIAVCFREVRAASESSRAARQSELRPVTIRALALAPPEFKSRRSVKGPLPLSEGMYPLICTCGGCASPVSFSEPEPGAGFLIECQTCGSLNIFE